MPWMMIWTLLWPTLVSILLAVAAWLMFRRGAPPMQVGRARIAAMVGAAAMVTAVHPFLGAAPLWIDAPTQMWTSVFDARFALPLVLGLLALVVLGAVRPRTVASSGALLAPRSWRSFLGTWWLGGLLGVVVLIFGLTIAAGMASQPNDAGEHNLYVVDFGSGAIGTTIYGWHHSLVPLTLCVLLCAATWWTLSRIAHPPLAATHSVDAADRRLRSTNTLRVTLGALLLHLEAILHSLANTSRMSVFFSGGDDLSFSTGTPFSALTGTLSVLAQVAGVLGLALWIFTALTAVPAPSTSRPSRDAAPS